MRTPIVAPRFTKEVVAEAGKVGQSAPRDIPTTGDAVASALDIVDAPRMPPDAKLEALKFMEDVLTVVVMNTADKSAKPIIDVGNGGRNQFLVRGVPLPVKRKFVEVLARAKPIQYTGETFIDRSTNEAVNRMNPNIGLLYPFSVQHDPAGEKGRLWLEQVLSEA